MRPVVACASLLLAACAGGPEPVEPPEGAVGSGPFGLLDGPYASVDLVPIPGAPDWAPPKPERLVLTNGLNVLLLQDAVLPLLELRLFLDMGTRDDPRGRTGTAELAARVMRAGGGATWPTPTLDDELASLGASLELRVGATSTEVRMRCLAEDFIQVLGMLEDVVRAPAFPEEVLERERARMLAEVAARDDDPGALASREARRAFFGRSDPRARRVEAEGLQALTRDDLVAFHRRHVGARRALGALLGDVDAATAATELDRRFGDWGGQIADAREALPSSSGPESGRLYFVDRPDAAQAEIRILHPGVEATHPDHPALLLGSWVLGTGGFGSRMMQRIRVELGLAYGAGAAWEAPLDGLPLFRVATATRNARFGATLEEVLGILDGLLADGIPEAELEAARARWARSRPFRFDTPGEVLWRTAELERRGLPWDHDARLAEAVAALDATAVVEACRRHLDLQRLLLFVVGDVASFDRAPQAFGTAEPWDVAATAGAAGGGEPPSDGAVAAAQLAARVVAQHGGSEVWSALPAVAVEAELGGVRKRILMAAPDRMAWFQAADGAVELVLAGERAWRPAGEPLAPGAVAALGAICQAELPILLMRLARGELQLESPAEGVLVAVDAAGRRMRLDLGPDGLVRRVTTDTQVQEFSDYALRAGVMLPGRLRQSDAGSEPFETALEAWDTAPEVPAGLFEPPQ